MCPLIQPDFSEVLEQLPEGGYKAQIVGAEMKTSKAGTPYIRWQLNVFDAPDARCNNKAVWYNTMISGAGAGRLKQFYSCAMGKRLEGSFDTQDLMGAKVFMTVVNGTDQNGNPSGFSEVKAVRSL